MPKARRPLASLFGENVRAMRARLGLSQTDLAKQIGIAQAYISSVENGQNTTLETVEKIAGALAVAPAVLLADPRLGVVV